MAFRMKGIKSLVNIDTPLQQNLSQQELEALDYTDTKFTKGIDGETIALEGTATIPGQEPTRIVRPGDPGYEQWLAAVEENPEIEDKFKDQQVIRERDYTMQGFKKRPDGGWYITTRDPQDGVGPLNFDPSKTIDIDVYEIEGMPGLNTPNDYLGKLYEDRGYDGTPGSISESDVIVSQEIWNKWRNKTGIGELGFNNREFTGDGKAIGGQTGKTSDYKYTINN